MGRGLTAENRSASGALNGWIATSGRTLKCRLWRTAMALKSLMALCWLVILMAEPALAAAPIPATVSADHPLKLPADFGAHPRFRSEWWYATGWLTTADGKPLGFQLTFFRSATDHDAANPSRFAPKQLIIAHAALSDPAVGHLQHDQRAAREGFGLAYAKVGNTDVGLDGWTLLRQADGSYRAQLAARDFTMALTLTPSQPPMLQGDAGISHKGAQPQQASYYYSEPHLQVSGSVQRGQRTQTVTGSAWLDHEWSSSYLDPDAVGWDWLGANLDDGAALMAFRMRDRNGAVLWSHAALRDASGNITQFARADVGFAPLRNWRSPQTGAVYPVAMQIRTGTLTWQLTPLQDDQELDSRQSTGAVYWEGAVGISRAGKTLGRGYLELTGYVQPLKL